MSADKLHAIAILIWFTLIALSGLSGLIWPGECPSRLETAFLRALFTFIGLFLFAIAGGVIAWAIETVLR